MSHTTILHAPLDQGHADTPALAAHKRRNALAVLVAEGVVDVQEAQDPGAPSRVGLVVDCSDVFAWGCADSQPLPLQDVASLWALWRTDPTWGAAIWCMQARRELGQDAVMAEIAPLPCWDIPALIKAHGLRANRYDGLAGVAAHIQHATYQDWCAQTGREALPFDAHWWTGWNAYTKNVPNWNSPAMKARIKAARAWWCLHNGWPES